MDNAQGDRSVLLWVATAGVLLSAFTTAATFTKFAAGFTFLRYPLLGAALGAGIIELWVRRDFKQSVRVGAGAFKGRLMGMVGKLAIGGVMLLIGMIGAFPH